MIAAYSPQARGRSERNFGTWQSRVPQELRVRGIADLARANEFLCTEYVAEFNRRFTVNAAEKGSAFLRARRKDLDWIFSLQHEHTVNQDNTPSHSRTECFSWKRQVDATRSPVKRWWSMNIWMGACPFATDPT